MTIAKEISPAELIVRVDVLIDLYDHAIGVVVRWRRIGRVRAAGSGTGNVGQRPNIVPPNSLLWYYTSQIDFE